MNDHDVHAGGARPARHGPCKPPPSVHDCHANNNWAPIFLLQERGSSNPSSGFEFASADIEPWMAAFKVCDSLRDM